MSGVASLVQLRTSSGARLPQDVVELVCSFLHLRPRCAFNSIPLMFGDLRGLSLHFLLNEVYRMIYLEGAFDRDGGIVELAVPGVVHIGIKYVITVIQTIGVGTEYGRVLLQSVFRAPGAASVQLFEWDPVFGDVLLQSVADSPGFAWTLLASPRHRLRNLLGGAMWPLENYMFPLGRTGDLNELELGFREMVETVGVYAVEGRILHL